MKKIPCLFKRDFTTRPPTLLREVTPGCEWVLDGIGRATRKWDGTAAAIIGGELYARYDAKRGKPAPDGAIPCDDPDPVTGHHPHWVKADRPCDTWIRAAYDGAVLFCVAHPPDGTYEAIGPKIGVNAERWPHHTLMRHGRGEWLVERSFDGIGACLAGERIEGLVFHHPDGRMCKIRRADYGLPWPITENP